MEFFKRMQRVWFWRGFLSVFFLYRPDPAKEEIEKSAAVSALMNEIYEVPMPVEAQEVINKHFWQLLL